MRKMMVFLLLFVSSFVYGGRGAPPLHLGTLALPTSPIALLWALRLATLADNGPAWPTFARKARYISRPMGGP